MCPSESSAGGRRLKLIALDLVSSVIAVSWDCKPRDFAREATDAGMRAPQGPRGGQASFLEYPKSSQSPALQGVEYEREAPARLVPTLARASGLYSDDRDGAIYKPEAPARESRGRGEGRGPRGGQASFLEYQKAASPRLSRAWNTSPMRRQVSIQNASSGIHSLAFRARVGSGAAAGDSRGRRRKIRTSPSSSSSR